MTEAALVNSFKWRPHIIGLIDSMASILKEYDKNSALAFHEERIESIFLLHRKNLDAIKRQMKTKDPIDRHKIITSYIKAVLDAKVFEYVGTNDPGVSLAIRIPNEMLAWGLLESILPVFIRYVRNQSDYKLRFPQNTYCYFSKRLIPYKEHFFKLMYHYAERGNEFPVFAISHIIFFFEMLNDCIFYNQACTYYPDSKDL